MKRRKEAWTGLLFASPWIVGFGVFLAYPLAASIYLSLCDYSVLRKPVFVGLHNYAEMLHDDVFWQSLVNTAIYAGLAIPVGLAVSISLALLLNTKVRGMRFYRAAIYLPSLVPTVSLAMVGMWMFNGERGLVNQLLKYVGITGPNWMGDVAWSKPALILMALWGVGNTVVIFLAGLQDVPVSLYESASLDGANAWHKTKFVTLPMISPVIQFNLIMGIIGALQIFAEPYIMFPNGAPARSTYFYTMYLFDNAFRYTKMGYACAMGWVLFFIIFALTMLSLKASEKRVHYGGM